MLFGVDIKNQRDHQEHMQHAQAHDQGGVEYPAQTIAHGLDFIPDMVSDRDSVEKQPDQADKGDDSSVGEGKN